MYNNTHKPLTTPLPELWGRGSLNRYLQYSLQIVTSNEMEVKTHVYHDTKLLLLSVQKEIKTQTG